MSDAIPHFHRFSVCIGGRGRRLEYATCERVFFKKYPDMCGRTGPNTYLPPINCSQVFLTVEHTDVVGAEILKEKEATWSTNMAKKHKKDSSMHKLHTCDERAGSK